MQDWKENYTLGEYHAKVRGNARQVYKLLNKPKACAACGYDLHVEVCHVRDVESFPLEATLDVVNAPSNLVALDKRCHWEFDNGFLTEEDFK